ncbi:MAG: homoserine kinase [Sorangiineae bacterium]|nr:homoserine kinase [Polyangiaceae bacterium]MEB2322514.1 homoserine kinase [Sorangiineae bacterium]
MALLTPMTLDQARLAARPFGLDLAAVEPLRAGSVNSNFRLTARDGSRWFARLYEEQGPEGAAAEVALVRALAERGVPTPAPLERTSGGALGAHAGRPLAIFPWVDGELLCQARVTRDACEAVGEALALVHLSGVAAPGVGRFTSAALEARLDRIERDAPPGLAEAAAPIRAALRRYSAVRDPALPRGLIHGDLFRDNVLWQGGRVAALIDFESAAQGPLAYDLMVTLLAWCRGARLEPELMRALLRGYRAHRELDARELAALPIEGAIACLRFATTRITDFAMRAPPGASPLRDYRRFLGRLAELEAGALDALRA